MKKLRYWLLTSVNRKEVKKAMLSKLLLWNPVINKPLFYQLKIFIVKSMLQAKVLKSVKNCAVGLKGASFVLNLSTY